MAFNRLINRQLSTTSGLNKKIHEFIVVGAGLMGAGIAQVGAQTNHKVTLVDNSEKALEKANKRISDSISRVAKKKFKDDAEGGKAFIESSMSNLTFTTSINESLASADLLVEAVVENLKLKQKLFKEWDGHAPEKTIFASNTSTFQIVDMASETKRMDRFGGLHFFNPVPVMKLLEVIRSPETSDETNDALHEWGKNMKKVTVQCKDTPGFIVNRLLIPYMAEAVAMVERRDASFKDVDTAMKLGAGYPMGPFELMDYVGLDLHTHIGEDPNNPLGRPSPMVKKMVEEGKLGIKSGEGFYKYSK